MYLKSSPPTTTPRHGLRKLYIFILKRDEIFIKYQRSMMNGSSLTRLSMFVYHWALVAGAWTEREKMYHGGSFLKLADDDMDIQNPEAQNRELGGF